jgi:pyruvate, water dikinase
MTPVALSEAVNASLYGGKAAQLCLSLRAGLPVPDGYGLDFEFVDAVVGGNRAALADLDAICSTMPWPVAVRSSAVGEDSSEASFAGQHATVLNAVGADAVKSALRTVWQSARQDSALAYRERMGADSDIKMGVVVQKQVASDVSGVLFTRHPVTGADEIVIESCWGLGETVVQGLVIPDFFRMDRNGAVLEARTGFKDVAIKMAPDGFTHSTPVETHLIEHACLTAASLQSLLDLVDRCDRLLGNVPHDIEWAFEGDTLYLLQRRPITKGAGH